MGFPTATGSFYNEPSIPVAVSIVDLRIAPEPEQRDGFVGRHAVFPTRCAQTAPDPPPKMISLKELLGQPSSKPYRPSEEEKRAPLIPADRQSIHTDAAFYAETFHDSHVNCEALSPLGYIWLDQTWRASKPKNCVMGFMALCGKKRKKAGWVITRLMLTERLKKLDQVWARERVHTMDCEISKDAWVKAGAVVLDQRFV